MSMCNQLESYMNRRMSEEDRTVFEQHLHECDACKAITARWDVTCSTLKKEIEGRLPDFDERATRTLLEGVERRLGRATAQWRTVTLVGAGAMVAATALLLFLTTSEVTKPPISPPMSTTTTLPLEILYPPDHSDKDREDAKGSLLPSTDDRLLAAVGQTRLGLEKRSRARVLRADSKAIRLELIEGRLAVSFPKKSPRAALSIQVRQVEISVVGTQFLTERDAVTGAVTVSVQEGVVQVTESGVGTWKVHANETFTTDAKGKWSKRDAVERDMQALATLLSSSSEGDANVPSPLENAEAKLNDEMDLDQETQPSVQMPSIRPRKSAAQSSQGPAGLDAIKQWILDGDFSRSERDLKRRLAKSPKDVASLQLLAVCQRKSGQPKQALKSYKQIIAIGAASQKNRARFRAGVILQDKMARDKEAIAMFSDYLKETAGGRPNALEARMRLAKSVKKTGDLEQYKKILRTVIENHGGTEAAVKAGRELNRYESR